MEEIMRGFDDLARSGKILYAGLSNFPAWRVARAATISQLRGTVPVAGLQIEHSLVQRATEQELIPAALALGLVAFSPIGGGLLTDKYRAGKAQDRRDQAWAGAGFQPENSPQRTAILDTLISVAEELGVTPGEVAIAWVAAKGSLPIIGPRTLAQLETNLAAANVILSAAQLARLDEVSAIPAVYPQTVLNERRIQDLVTGDMIDRIDMPVSSAA